MKCPNCTDTTLVMADRQGVEIDYCPKCRGVWLDRGELDKIIERSAAAEIPPQPAPAPQAAPPPQGGFAPQGYGQGYPYKKRRKSFLEELFD